MVLETSGFHTEGSNIFLTISFCSFERGAYHVAQAGLEPEASVPSSTLDAGITDVNTTHIALFWSEQKAHRVAHFWEEACLPGKGVESVTA